MSACWSTVRPTLVPTGPLASSSWLKSHEVWGYHSVPSTRTVDVHVAWLRQKLEDNPRHPQFILTIHGPGYKFLA